MRPTDENQAGSTRPNLMSSRRAVGEDNILAMLERDSARRTGTRASNLRLACYGAAAAFAGILVGGVAWLAYDNHKTAERLQAGHDALVAVPPVVASADLPPQLSPPMLTAPAAAPAVPPAVAPAAAQAADTSRAAVIVDGRAPAVRTAGSSLPPLVMLQPEETAPAQVRHALKPAPRLGKETPKELTKAPTKESAQAAVTTPTKPRTVQAAARSSGDRKADKKKVNKHADKAQRTAARTAKTTPQRGAAKTAADATRQRKLASAPPQVDSDVALISAIISQSERHRGEREAAAACDGAKCPPKQTQP